MNTPTLAPHSQKHTVYTSTSDPRNRSYDSRWGSLNVKPVYSGRNPFIAGGADFTEGPLLEVAQDTNEYPSARVTAAGLLSWSKKREDILINLAQDKTLDARARLDAWDMISTKKISEEDLLEIAQDTKEKPRTRLSAAQQLPSGERRENILINFAQDKTWHADNRISAVYSMARDREASKNEILSEIAQDTSVWLGSRIIAAGMMSSCPLQKKTFS